MLADSKNTFIRFVLDDKHTADSLKADLHERCLPAIIAHDQLTTQL